MQMSKEKKGQRVKWNMGWSDERRVENCIDAKQLEADFFLHACDDYSGGQDIW